jgi:hypothetical protein
VSDWRNKLPSAYDYRESARARNTGERFACVVNPKAKAGEVGARIDEIRRAVDRAFEQWEVFVSEGPGHATDARPAGHRRRVRHHRGARRRRHLQRGRQRLL